MYPFPSNIDGERQVKERKREREREREVKKVRESIKTTSVEGPINRAPSKNQPHY